jgi:hypothetical protein
MGTTRFALLLTAVLSLSSLSISAWSQQKHAIQNGPPATSRYVQEHAIDVGDTLGHQVRVYQLHYEYPKDSLVFDGVQVTQSTTNGMSDYTNWNGSFTTYSVFVLEDGNKIFTRGGGATQTGPDGTRSYSYVDNILGGTGRFRAIRGQMRGKGQRAAGANSVMETESSGEYWLEQ